jgi:serine/threonine protein kinase
MTEPREHDMPNPAADKPAAKGQPRGIPGPGGVILDEFVLLEQLAASRTGLIFKAEHRIMGRTVAIKFLAPAAAASEMLTTRFHRTVRILSRLEHRNLVRAYQAGQQGEAHYLVMEYVEGKDLRAILKERGPLPVEDAVNYIAQAAAGLGYAHENGVWHRNIKPANLLVDAQGVVKIIGFGLAHVEAGKVMDEDSLDENLTRQGQVMGTYDFMSPEQAVDSSSPDARADIYSLGCTLHALVTGRPPYVTKSRVQQVMAHRSLPIPSLRGSRPEVPEALNRIFRKMVAKRPEDRYASMKELLAELGTCLKAPPAADETTGERLQNLLGLESPWRDSETDVDQQAKPERAWRRLPLLPIIAIGSMAVAAFLVAVQFFPTGKHAEVATSKTAKTDEAKPSVAKPPEPEPSRKAIPPAKTAPKQERKPNVKPNPDLNVTPTPELKQEPPSDPPPDPLPDPVPDPPEPPTPKPGRSPLPVPDAAARAQALKYLKDTFDVGAAKTATEKGTLAKVMIIKSRGMSDDPAGRFVLLETSLDLARSANDSAMALAAADDMAHFFVLDAWAMKSDLLAEMAKQSQPLLRRKDLVNQALLLNKKALAARKFEIAAKLAGIAVAEAKRTGDRKLLAGARDATRESGLMLDWSRKYQTANAKLKEDPRDPEANQIAGQYLCVVEDKWKAGLQKLKLGNEPRWRDLADKDLADPKEARDQAAVGDAWRDLGEQQDGVAQASLYRRAVWWYKKALPQATGLLRDKLEKGIATLKAAESKRGAP